MSNHIKGNWFVSVFKMAQMSREKLQEIAESENYRPTTRRNARIFMSFLSDEVRK